MNRWTLSKQSFSFSFWNQEINSLVFSVDTLNIANITIFFQCINILCMVGLSQEITVHWTELPGQIIRGLELKAQRNWRVRPTAPEGEEAAASDRKGSWIYCPKMCASWCSWSLAGKWSSLPFGGLMVRMVSYWFFLKPIYQNAIALSITFFIPTQVYDRQRDLRNPWWKYSSISSFLNE